MTGETVLEILDILHASGVEAWIDGGWGVDALLRTESRPHDDLDLVVALADVPRIREDLEARGFVLGEEQLPVRFTLVHPERGAVDFHTVALERDGGGLQPQPDGRTFRYPPEGFVSGSIHGRVVPCVSTEVQVLCHRGYEPQPKDVQDVLALHRAFGVRLPTSYRRFLPKSDLTP